MNLFRFIVASALLLAVIPRSFSQQNAPHVGYVYPAGGQQGTIVQVKIGGQFLMGSTNTAGNLFFSGAGLRGNITGYDRPLTPQQQNALRQEAQKLAQGQRNPATQAQIANIRGQISNSQRRNANPAISEFVTASIAVAGDAEPGQHELRLRTPSGLSNPIIFCVGQLPEFVKPFSQTNAADTEFAVRIPATINGQLVPRQLNPAQAVARPNQQTLAGDIDRYRFRALQGQQLIAAVSARELIPFLADAVPGWLQASLTLRDSDGKELAYCDDYQFHPDPVIHYKIPQDGEYVLEIKDALFRGREDFVYRIAVGELPFATGVFPLGAPAHSTTEVLLSGWNLESNRQVIDCLQKEPGVYTITARKGNLISNPMPFLVDSLPEIVETEPNNTIQQAQPVSLPLIVNGRIGEPGDWDVFCFEGKQGESVVAEITARRLDSPLDSILRLTDSSGRQLVFNDDADDKGSGLETHHADSYFRFALPINGKYFVQVGDVQQHGGSEYGYRLRISSPRPDFELRVTPSAINAVMGPTAPVTVHALRKDGFAGAIALSLKNAPRGYLLTGGVVPANRDEVQLTLSVPAQTEQRAVSIAIEGRAAIQGQEVAHLAVPADDRMQAFAYRHLVTTKELRVSSTGRGPAQAALRIIAPRPLKIPSGGSAPVQIAFPALFAFESVQLQLNNPPEGISVREVVLGPPGATVIVQSDAGKAKSGLKGNLVLNVTGQRGQGASTAGNQPARANRPRLQLGTLPAIPFEIVSPQGPEAD